MAETINIHYAKTNLSKLIERAERGEELTISRAGKPVVKLTPVHQAGARKLGFLKGVFDIPTELFDPGLDARIAADFENSRLLPDENPH